MRNKKLILLFAPLFLVLAGIAQKPVKTIPKDSIEAAWKRVNDFINKNLPKSALTEAQHIYQLAKKQNNDAQVIKALVYITTLQQDTRENNAIASIADIEKEITISHEPATSLLNTCLASLYWDYYNQQRWKLYSRTETTGFKKEDIATWGTNDFHQKISELFLQSLKNEKILQQTSLEAYDPIILKGNMRYLRPTLFDLLAFRALEYFENDERDIKKPAYAFEIDQPEAFAPAASFISAKFPTKDSVAQQQKALLIYQQLIAFHLHDKKPDALIDADIHRLEFVKQNSVLPDKNELFFAALQHIAAQYGDNPAAAQAWYLEASYYNELADTYQPNGDTTHRFDRLKAKAICENVLNQKDSSEGWVNCYNLLNTIQEAALTFTMEKVQVPQQAFRTLVNYRNFSTLHLRLISVDNNIKKILDNLYNNDNWSTILRSPSVKSWEQPLPVTNDYQTHDVEIKMEGLPPGEYVLLAATSNDFTDKRTIIGAKPFYVSSISYVNSYEDYFVLDRDNGQPLAGAKVQTWDQKYDYKTSKYISEKGDLYTADANGYFRFASKKDQKNNYSTGWLFDITYKNDELFMDTENYDYYSNRNTNDSKDITAIFLFTDRGIYRPGQTVYFKGIVLTKNANGAASVRSGYQTEVYLRNANRKDVDTIKVKTNEYGSFSGKFQLPETGLNGEFGLYTKKDAAYINFRMEEYKRPQFHVDYEKIKGTYKVNEKIKVTGIAKAYAGNNIDGATVKYRVVRQPRYLYYWMFRGWMPPTAEMEIAHGELTTDKAGKFQVEFTAIPDLKVNKQYDPVFDYTVFADVTDINGETRSAHTMISAGYKSLVLQVNVPATLPADSLRDISIYTQNMNGSFEPAQVTVKMSRLKEEKRLIRPRLWTRPDQFVMSKEEYIRNFPNDEYDNESDYKSWEKGATILERIDSSRDNGQWAIDNRQLAMSAGQKKFEPGFYELEISAKAANGDMVKDIQYIELYDEKSNQLNRQQYIWSAPAKPIEPGEKTSVALGTSASHLFVVQQLEKKSDAFPKYNFLSLDNEKKSFEFGATDADRGGYGVGWIFVKHNRFYQYQQTIMVPWDNKDLSIEYASFRDNVLPGSEEKWKVKITGYKKDNVAAEMLASMYDASLDQFADFAWNVPGVWPYYYSRSYWNGTQNFSPEQSFIRQHDGPNQKNFVKEYDALLDLINDIRNPRLMRLPKLLYAEDKVQAVGQTDIFIGGNQMAKKDTEKFVTGYGTMQAQRKLTGDKERISDDVSVRLRGLSTITADNKPLLVVDGVIMDYSKLSSIDPNDILTINILKDAEATGLYGEKAKYGVVIITTKNGSPKINDAVQVRKNFNETAFFFPELYTDSTGAIEFSFTMPEALTKWKFQALSHTKDLAFGYSTKEIVTQKQLMVQPNMPRFMREGDHMEFSAKIANLTEKEFTGQATLELFDAVTNEPVDGAFQNRFANQYFTVAAGQSEAVKFPIEVPYHFNKALVWRIVAKAESFSDGEEAALPVLTNRTLVTETMPLPMRTAGTKNFSFTKLLQSGNSETLQQYGLTVEYTSNPAWYAVQSLPYLMEYPYECAEQTWNRYYANSLASMIANSSPRIQQIFEQWRTEDTAALMSNLQKNEELKSVLLEETPWVLQAKTEAQQKKNIALLFDLVRMSKEQNKAYDKLKQMQASNGGFVWFSGGPDDRYMTQYIVTGIGHLRKIMTGNGGKGFANGQLDKLKSILGLAIPYLDRKIKQDYDELVRDKVTLDAAHIGYIEIQYLYMRSFFPEYSIDKGAETAYNYYLKQAQRYWTIESKYMEGMIALALNRHGDTKTPADILKSLKETSISNEEMGAYWKEISNGWFWYEAPIETQALMIEVFQEAGKDLKMADDLRTWLLKNKQTNDWKTTIATAEACYALLLQGTDGWLTQEPVVEIKLGNTVIRSTDNKQEAGTGYFKQRIDGDKVEPGMGNIAVTVSPSKVSPDGMPATWGGVYWQYFEDLDKITTASTPLKLVKKLFIEKNTDRGPVLSPVNEGEPLKIGDKIKVRIELRVDRDMEYVQMKDMRASCLEPVNVLSSFKWQGGLGYYESTKDASTNFFFHELRKGTYVFEYPLFVTHAGEFSNGITTIQCMYAPEFSSHSEGIRITVE